MQLGIFAKTFAGNDPLTVLEACKAAGYEVTQYNLACSKLPSMPIDLDNETLVISEIAKAVEKTGIKIAGLSGTYNMAHPNAAVRERGLQSLDTILRLAAALNIPVVTLCTGSRHLADQWAWHSENTDPSAWVDMSFEMSRALDLAEGYGVNLGIEPEQANIVRTAKDATKLIKEMKSKRLKIVLDPANLFEKSDVDTARNIVAESVEISAEHLGMIHAKDRNSDGSFATAGHGIVDFQDFLTRVQATGFNGPLITHGLDASEAKSVAGFLKGVLK